MQVILEPTIQMTEEEIKAVRIVRDMLVEVESGNVDQVSTLNENFLDYIDYLSNPNPFIVCVDFLSSLLVGAGVEDENGIEKQ
jgi:hypothetical protein